MQHGQDTLQPCPNAHASNSVVWALFANGGLFYAKSLWVDSSRVGLSRKIVFMCVCIGVSRVVEETSLLKGNVVCEYIVGNIGYSGSRGIVFGNSAVYSCVIAYSQTSLFCFCLQHRRIAHHIVQHSVKVTITWGLKLVIAHTLLWFLLCDVCPTRASYQSIFLDLLREAE